MIEAWLLCEVFPGQFSTEYAVSSTQADGEGFSLFVPARFVKPTLSPTETESVPGQVRVEIWDRKGEEILVRLPGPTLERGLQFVTVPSRCVEANQVALQSSAKP